MRLTLRTLLAYMDDILEPEDHEDLGKKIEASDFASELIHRSRDTVRRLRLSAPPVLATASDDLHDSVDLSDANSVAEYLDNTLPPEQVADFERMCLEVGNTADMHLAEVASCHHVLTMVLGEPAEVDADLKSRLYKIPTQLANGQKLRIEPSHAAPPVAPPLPTETAQTQTIAPPPPVAVPDLDSHSELPDYLRAAADSQRRTRRWMIAASLLAVGAFLAWFLNPPAAELSPELAKSEVAEFDGDIDLDITGIDDATTVAPTDTDSALEEAPAFVPKTAAAAPAFVPGSPAEAAEAPAFQPGAPVEQPATAEVEETPETDLAAGLSADEPSTEDQDTGIGDIDLLELPTELSTTTIDPPGAAVAPEAIDRAAVEQPAAATTEKTPAEFPATDDAPLVIDTTEPAEPEPQGPQRLGGYMGNDDVLLSQDAATGKWIRLPPRSAISTGDSLLTLPKFLTHVVLADVNTYLSGGTHIQIPVDRFETSLIEADLNVEVVYGRLLLNAGLKGSQVAMKIGDQLREFSLASSAGIAVDVRRVFVPGSDFENELAPVEAVWYLTDGVVEWPTATGEMQKVEAPAMWKTIDGIDEIPELLQELPDWIGREAVTDVERIARDDLAKELEADQPVGISLLELTAGKGIGRKKEVRILASAASVYVGEFEPIVNALSDSEQSRAWEAHIDDLRRALAQSPEVAARVKQAVVNIRGEEAAQDLMKMLAGFSREEIGQTREEVNSGAMPQLLKWLDSDSLDYRLLAIRNIREITGKFKGYRPDDSSKRRKIALRKLWDDFESNELLPKS